MKKILILATLLSTTFAFANDKNAKFAQQMNQVSKYESKLRKFQSELHLRNKQVVDSTNRIKKMNNDYADLHSKYRQLASEAQYLKYQNDQLIYHFKKTGKYTPELAKKMDQFKGRMPASVKAKKK